MKTYIYLAITLLLCSGTALAETPFSRTISAVPGGEVSVEIISGKLTVAGWDRNEVHIEGTLGDDVEEVRVEADGNDIRIEVKLDDHAWTENGGSWTRNEGYADLEIFIPADSKIELESVAVETDVYGIRGPIEIEAVSGNISISGRSRVIEIESVSGKIWIENGADEIDIESVSGKVSIAGDFMTDVEIQSVSGDVEFEGNLDGNGNLSVENVSGNVQVLLPADISTRFNLSTFSGNLESDFDGMMPRKQKFVPAQDASFTVGSGFGSEISIETFSGDIAIRKR